ncbi:glycoside hydrolase family 28 protein [Pseudomonas luteola]
MSMFSRRRILASMAGGAAGLALINLQGCSSFGSGGSGQTNDWAMADAIRRKTTVPRFPNVDFDIRRYGAVGDGRTDNSKAFAAAIQACFAAGGGRVLVTGGDYLTGPIHLKSNINLHIEEGAKIRFITDPKAYLPAVFTRWEGMELMGYSPLIYAYRQKNIAITGKGELDGQADRTTWWPWKGNKEWGVEGYLSGCRSRSVDAGRGGWRTTRATAVCRRLLFPSTFRAALPMRERADRGCAHHTGTLLAFESSAVRKRDCARRAPGKPGPELGRLRP